MANNLQQGAGMEQWPVDCKYQKCGEMLGKGTFGSVYPVRRLSDGKEFAVKLIERVLPSQQAENAKLAKLAERELQCWARLFHAHIVQFKECFLTPIYLCLVLELVKGPTLYNFVNQRGGLPEKQARWFFHQMMFAIEYCHSEKVVHRDITLNNILLDQTQSPEWPWVKLTDFGWSKCTVLSECHTNGIGTSVYMAPEVLDGANTKYDGKVDVWSAGVILYAMLYCQYPFGMPNDMNGWQEMTQRIRGVKLIIPGRAPAHTGPVSEQCADFIRQLLDVRERRLSVEQVISHPWFQIDLPAEASTLSEKCRLAPRKAPQSPEAINAIVQEAFGLGTNGFGGGYGSGRGDTSATYPSLKLPACCRPPAPAMEAEGA